MRPFRRRSLQFGRIRKIISKELSLALFFSSTSPFAHDQERFPQQTDIFRKGKGVQGKKSSKKGRKKYQVTTFTECFVNENKNCTAFLVTLCVT